MLFKSYTTKGKLKKNMEFWTKMEISITENVLYSHQQLCALMGWRESLKTIVRRRTKMDRIFLRFRSVMSFTTTWWKNAIRMAKIFTPSIITAHVASCRVILFTLLLVMMGLVVIISLILNLHQRKSYSRGYLTGDSTATLTSYEYWAMLFHNEKNEDAQGQALMKGIREAFETDLKERYDRVQMRY